jgi:putative endonuclease
MGARHLELGKRAEDLAAAHVERLGWQILSRNFSCKLGELDIVAIDKQEKELVVVEVRYRTYGEMQSPSDSIGPKKLRALVNAGRVYVDGLAWTGPWRIDLLGVTALPSEPEQRWQLEHVKDITGGAYPV